MQIVFLTLLVVALMLSHHIDAESDWVNICNKCKCQWKSGKKSADCKNTSQLTIPKDLSPDIQVLDLSFNGIFEVSRDEFKDASLHNLHKLFMQNCSLLSINRDALKGLDILIELNLSNNQLKILHAGTFSSLVKIRTLLLNDNQLEKLDDQTFDNLLFLNKIDLKANRITRIGIQTFFNLPKLTLIQLDENRLHQLHKDSFEQLPRLSSLSLSANPWNCTCLLKVFRDFSIDHNLYTAPTACHDPPDLRDKLWTDVPSEKFACKPQILAPRAANYFKASSENATISCKARGSPAPDILWLYNKRPINTHDQRLTVKTYKEINKREILELVTSELTISGLRHYDKGSYICAAINSGGREEVELQLDLTIELLNKRTFISDANNTMFMIVCIILGFLFILLFTVVIVCCYCRKVKNQQKKSSVSDNNRLITVGGLTKSNGKSLNESVLDGSVIIEMQKSLLTEVNPVEKPPRRTELDSIEKDLEDAHDANQTLLDEETAFIHDEESSSIQLSDSMPRARTTYVDDGYGANLPPDLLAFPSRFPQSPSNQSSISNIHDGRIFGKSPMSSPIYDFGPSQMQPSGYRTLQHPKTGRTIAIASQRSNSPFTPGPLIYPQMVLKQGYTTIPRKPRTPSWAVSSVSDFPSISPTAQTTPELVEPVYDNLGLRTTASGNSVLNLNKLSQFNGLSTNSQNYSSMKNRPLPATPGHTQKTGETDHVRMNKERPKPPPKPKKKPQTSNGDLNHQNDTINSHEFEGEDGTEV